MWFILLPFYFVCPLVIVVELIYTLFFKKSNVPPIILKITDVVMVALFPLLFLVLMDTGDKNECCSYDTYFSPQHRLSLYVIVFFCASAYFYSTFRKGIAPPILELAVNSLLMTGIALNVLIIIQFKGDWPDSYLPCTISIILLFILRLIKNQRALIAHLESFEVAPKNFIEAICWKILRMHPVVKTPVFILLALPLLVIITGVLLIFGQKPDSLIRAFTDTYHQGFSQLDHECDNVQCGGHYLCSVAAKGHKKIVKPQRLGERLDHKIICNRQLLVSNAFEELLQEKLPFIHPPVRKLYNNVGNMVHRHYGIFNNKYVADTVYLLMKPLEWFFVLVLYTCDTKPENRIASQYLSLGDRQHIKNMGK